MTFFSADLNELAALDLGVPQPKATTLTPGQTIRWVNLYGSGDADFRGGVWECTPGRFTAHREKSTEVCLLLSGKVTLHHPPLCQCDLRQTETSN